MRKASVLLAGILVLLLFSFCAKKPKVQPEPKPPTTQEQPTKPETPKEEKRMVTQEDLQPIYFDFDKYDLRAGDREILNLNAMVLKENSTVRIRIEGNCDERGTVEYNLALGEKRAKAALDYLLKMGIDPSRISTVSYGKERPMDPGHDEAAWAKNRRDDFVIVKQ